MAHTEIGERLTLGWGGCSRWNGGAARTGMGEWLTLGWEGGSHWDERAVHTGIREWLTLGWGSSPHWDGGVARVGMGEWLGCVRCVAGGVRVTSVLRELTWGDMWFSQRGMWQSSGILGFWWHSSGTLVAF